jgi:hypothetical protein
MVTVMNDFDFLHGTWTVHHRRLRDRMVGSDDWEEFDGTTVCAPILGGLGNFEQVWMPARNAIGATLRLFDRDAEQWSIYWASSLTGRLEPPVTGRFHDGVGTFLGDDVHDGQPVRVRFIWDEISPTTARWNQAFAPADADDWETNWVMRLTRVADATRNR